MRKAIMVLALFLSCLPLFSQAHEKRAHTKDPFLHKAQEREWDFGKVREGQMLKHNFMLKNNSSRSINITGMNTSCGCTSSKARRKDIPPGESVAIETYFNSKGYSGPVEQFIYVHTDDPDNEVIRYTIRAEVAK